MNFWNDMIGWLGTILLTVCSFPQLMLTWKRKTVQGLSLAMIWLWFFGLIFMLVYVMNSTKQIILLVDYGLNIFVVLAILWGYRRAQLYQERKQIIAEALERERARQRLARKRNKRKKTLLRRLEK